MKRIFALLLLLFLCLTASSCKKAPADTETVNPNTLPPIIETPVAQDTLTVYLVGDSTVRTYQNKNGSIHSSNLARDLMGWGYYLPYYFNESVDITVLANSGASSLAYLESTEYDTLIKNVSAGDYVFIQFGHNDQANDIYHTDPSIPLSSCGDKNIDAYGRYSFEAILSHNYVEELLGRGAIPVLVSPITRRAVDGRAHAEPHLPYARAMQNVAEHYDIAFIDLTDITADYYAEVFEKEGAVGTERLHAFTDADRTTIDNTHLSNLGAYTVASFAANEMTQKIPVFEEYRLEEPLEFDSKVKR